MNFVTRGIRDAFRNSVRTLSIVLILGLSIGLSLAMLIANRAVGQKITSVKSSIGNTITISPAGMRGFEGGGDALTSDQMKTIASLAHVKSLSQSLNDRLTTSDTNLQSAIDAGSLGKRFGERSGLGSDEKRVISNDMPPAIDMSNFKPPITIIGTTDTTALEGSSIKFTSGSTIDGSSTDTVAIVGKTLADKNSLKVGSTFQAYGKDITVKGIFDTGNSFTNNQILVPLGTLQTLSAQTGSVTSATVTIDSISNIDAVTATIKSKLGDKADVTSSKDTVASAVAPLESIQKVSMFSLIGSATAGAVIILLTMIMIVRERKREIGVIKAIGGSNVRIMSQFMVESLTLAMLGAVIGILIGAVGANPVTKMLVTNSENTSVTTSVPGPNGMQMQRPAGGFMRRVGQNSAIASVKNINATVGWDIIGYGLGAVALISLVGSASAAGLISKIRPSQVMRTE